MLRYAAQLGHQPHISVAELAAVVPGFALEAVIRDSVALFTSTQPLDDRLIDQLGGTMILAEQITENTVEMSDIPQLLHNEVKDVKRKITFGLRAFGVAPKKVDIAYRQSKDKLRKADRSCRYIGNGKKPAATALLLDSDILDGKRGVELFIVNHNDNLWVGKTFAAQNIDEYTWRDMEKPVRDTGVGLLPPKLAQIMLNFGAWLAAPEEEPKPSKRKRKLPTYTIFDPFCGTGVIPLECLLRGWPVLASDKAKKAMTGTEKNLDWLRKERKILKKDVSSTVWQQDATKPFALKDLPDAVVTETTLGPNLESRPTKKDARAHCKENEQLQADFLKNASETLPGVPLAVIWPVWRMKGEALYLTKIWDAVEEYGYEAVLPEGTTPTSADRQTLVYQRRDQFVGREIVLLRPVNKEN